jgi:hypothetical protein
MSTHLLIYEVMYLFSVCPSHARLGDDEVRFRSSRGVPALGVGACPKLYPSCLSMPAVRMGVEAGSILVGFSLTPESILILHIELPLEDVHWSGEIEEEAPTLLDGSTEDII